MLICVVDVEISTVFALLFSVCRFVFLFGFLKKTKTGSNFNLFDKGEITVPLHPKIS